MGACSYSIFIKLIGLISVILAMTLLGVCGWTLANTFKPDTSGFLDIETGISVDAENNNGTTEVVSFESGNYTLFGSEKEIPGSPDEDVRNFNVIRVWETMSPNFKHLIQLCTSVGIATALFQLLLSMIVLCSTEKRIRGKIKCWQLSHFIIILVLLMCILIPLSYNREKDKFRGALSFGKYLKSEFTNLIYPKQAQPSSSSPDESLIQFFMRDLNSYYVVLSCNVISLFHFLLMTCCCVQCRAKNYYQSV